MERLQAASDFMVTRMITLTPEAGVLDGIARLLENRITGAPVVGSRQTYLGVFSEKCSMEVLTAAAEHHAELRGRLPAASAADIMQTDLVTLDPEMDALEAIGLLLENRISGAPVVDSASRYLGGFSEKTSMSVLMASSYDQMPAGEVGFYMDPDPRRLISEDLDLLSIARIFLNTPYRRLPVVRDGVLLGQISRRDVLAAAMRFAARDPEYLETLRDPERGSENTVSAFADHRAKTIQPGLDLLRIATVFNATPYRRLPVLDGELIAGLVSRRDVLAAARRTLLDRPRKRPGPLYLSAVAEAPPPSVG